MGVVRTSLSPLRQRVGEGYAFGTFGELLQGVLIDGGRARHFLVTLPITQGSTARFEADVELRDIEVNPPHKVKSQQLARDLLHYLDLPHGGRLQLQSPLPEGKGLASSSADLVATARAIAAHFSLTLTRPLLQSLMRRIEPSDGVMYDEITAFYHRDVELLDCLGAVPPLTILAVDEGGQVDTVTFNQQPAGVTPQEPAVYAELLEVLRRAIASGDLGVLGRVATRSAQLNQSRLNKRWLDTVVDISTEVGALGVVAAHSGTQLGILLSSHAAEFQSQLVVGRTRLLALAGHVTVYHSRSHPDRS